MIWHYEKCFDPIPKGILIGFILLFDFARIWMFKNFKVLIAMPMAQCIIFLQLLMCHTCVHTSIMLTFIQLCVHTLIMCTFIQL